MLRPALFFACLLGAAPASADCDHFKWSVEHARQAFAAPERLASVGGVALPGKGYAVTLTQGLDLPRKPERDPKPGSYAAVIETPKLEAGLYQITLSQEAWIEVAQGGKVVKSSDFSGQHDCPDVRKSVRFPLRAESAQVVS